MERKRKRRHNTGFGYIGAGNNPNVFNRKPRAAFSEIKDKLHSESLKSFSREYTNDSISSSERLQIKREIRQTNILESIKIVVLTFIIVVVLIIIAIKMLEGVLFHSL